MRGVAVIRIVLVLLVAMGARVAEARDGIVLESYTGDRPASASATLGALLTELSGRGFTAGEGAGRLYDAKASRVAGPALPGDLAEQLTAGLKLYISGKYEEAIAALSPLIDAAHASSGTFARNQPLREKLVDSLIALAMAQSRSGDPRAARQTFAELVRSFPGTPVLKATWGPEAANLFTEVQKDLRGQSTGRMIIKLTNENAEVFINERYEQRGTTVKDLVPGEYRVVVQQGRKQSRIHFVTVNPGVETSVSIDLVLDAVVHTSPWAGFSYGTTQDREKFEVAHASAFANAIGERAVIVIGIGQVGGRAAIVGVSISAATGRENRRASIFSEPPPSVDARRSLAAFLAGDPAAPGIDVQLDGEAPGQLSPATGPGGGPVYYRADGPGRWKGWTYIVGALAVGALGTGVTLLVLDGHCPDGSNDDNCPNVYSTRTPALITLGGGAVLAGVTLYLIFDRPAPASRGNAFLTPTSGGAMAGYSLRF